MKSGLCEVKNAAGNTKIQIGVCVGVRVNDTHTLTLNTYTHTESRF